VSITRKFSIFYLDQCSQNLTMMMCMYIKEGEGYSMLHHSKALNLITCHYSDQHNQCNMWATHDDKGECYTVSKYTTAFLYSYWFYFVWHSINQLIKSHQKRRRTLRQITFQTYKYGEIYKSYNVHDLYITLNLNPKP